MHHIYHTEAIILGSRNFGEAEKYYYCFTRDFGLIKASAQGVRKMSSKLRYVLQDFSFIKVDLVRGKDFWRITSAEKTEILENLSKQVEALPVLVNISRLLKRLLPGEEANQALFTNVLHGFSMLGKLEKKEDFYNTEIILVLRILNNLGYIGRNDAFLNFIESPFEEDIVFEAAKQRGGMLREINKALRETHL